MMEMTKEEIINKAYSGDQLAMGILGEAYLHGNSELEQDYEKAFEWSEKAYKKGNVRSGTVLGIMYMDGLFVSKDLEKAEEYFDAAAEKGDMKAPRYQGLLSMKKAFDFFLVGAERGDITSQFYLGKMYENGECVEKNMDEAVKWYRKSAERRDKIAQPAMEALKRLGY